MTTDGHRPTRIVIDETHRHSNAELAEFQRAFNEMVADITAAEYGAYYRYRVLLGHDAARDDHPHQAPPGDIAYPDDHGTGCWKTLPNLDVCNAPVPDDDPLGLCPTHHHQLRSDA